VSAGDRVRFQTSDEAYAGVAGSDIDALRVDFRRVNRLTGPVSVEGAEAGDAVGFEIESIEIGSRAFAVYVATWRRRLFGVGDSSVVEVRVAGERVELEDGRWFPIRPMVGCIGVAPARDAISSLSPTGMTGGNMDLVELSAGTTIWFPVQVSGGLLSLGDIHARMGRGEPLGSGLECAGEVTGVVRLAKAVTISGPVFTTTQRIGFVGTSDLDWRDAESDAARAAWRWVTHVAALPERDAIAVCAGLLEIDAGGPAGNNVVASFSIPDLLTCGVDPSIWPILQPS
jgi:amidase